MKLLTSHRTVPEGKASCDAEAVPNVIYTKLRPSEYRSVERLRLLTEVERLCRKSSLI
jgi:hypothetical protein